MPVVALAGSRSRDPKADKYDLTNFPTSCSSIERVAVQPARCSTGVQYHSIAQLACNICVTIPKPRHLACLPREADAVIGSRHPLSSISPSAEEPRMYVRSNLFNVWTQTARRLRNTSSKQCARKGTVTTSCRFSLRLRARTTRT